MRLWRVGGPKYYLFVEGISEIQKEFNITRKKASLINVQKPTLVNRDSWLEEFFCSEHGKIWLRISKSPDGTLKTFQAKDKDWKHTSRTIYPDNPNSSVSEFTYNNSRQKGKKYFNAIIPTLFVLTSTIAQLYEWQVFESKQDKMLVVTVSETAQKINLDSN